MMRELPNVADLPKQTVPLLRAAILQRRVEQYDDGFLHDCGICSNLEQTPETTTQTEPR